MMQGNWVKGVIITFILLLLNTAIGGTNVASDGQTSWLVGLGMIFLYIPLTFGVTMLFLNFVQRRCSLDVEKMFGAFNAQFYWKSIALYLLTYIYTLLWTLLLVIPGIIKSLSYFLAPYILAENPDLSAEQAIQQSMAMMQGHKMQLFLMTLGLVGLAFLSVLLLGIPLLWIIPYYEAVFANFYEEVKQSRY